MKKKNVRNYINKKKRGDWIKQKKNNNFSLYLGLSQLTLGIISGGQTAQTRHPTNSPSAVLGAK